MICFNKFINILIYILVNLSFLNSASLSSNSDVTFNENIKKLLYFCVSDKSIKLPGFPSSIELTQRTFHNWADNIIVPNLWTAIPKTPLEALEVVNWATTQGYKVRPSGFMHTWGPLTVTEDLNHVNSSFFECPKTPPKIILVSTREYFTQKKMLSRNVSDAFVRVQTGVSIDNFLEFLEEEGFTIQGYPAPGDITIGGVIAIGGHGTGVVPSTNQISGENGFTYGTISNLLLEMEAIVWDHQIGKFIIKRFIRTDPEINALLVSVGRTFITEVILRVGPNFNLRCVSRLDIPASELFADPSSPEANAPGARTYQSFLESANRVETIWFALTDKPWLKTWTETPKKPKTSREVTSPYNYPFSDNFPDTMTTLLGKIVTGASFLTPIFMKGQYDIVAKGLKHLKSSDIWGPSKNLLLYVRPSTLRLTANGYAILTSKTNVQKVVSQLAKGFKDLLAERGAMGQYPINGPLEIRVSGLDKPEDIRIPGAKAPTLSVIRPIPHRPDLDVAVWMDILTFPETPTINLFMSDFEKFLFREVDDGRSAIVRPEWSKGWGYTQELPWANLTVINEVIPPLYLGDSENKDWSWSISTLNKYDPHHVYSNEFLDKLLD